MGLALGGVIGCAGYRLGPTTGAGAGQKTIQVNPFRDQTLEPGVATAVTAAVRNRFQQDGTFRLTTREEGDLIVSGVITRFTRTELTYQSADILTVRDYKVALTAQVTVRDRNTGAVILDRLVTGTTPIRAGADFPSTERQALPLLADDLAKKIADLVVNGSW